VGYPTKVAAYLFPLGSYLIPFLLYRTKVAAYLIWILLYRTRLGSYLFSFHAYLIRIGSYLFCFRAYLIEIGSYLFSSDKEETNLGSYLFPSDAYLFEKGSTVGPYTLSTPSCEWPMAFIHRPQAKSLFEKSRSVIPRGALATRGIYFVPLVQNKRATAMRFLWSHCPDSIGRPLPSE